MKEDLVTQAQSDIGGVLGNLYDNARAEGVVDGIQQGRAQLQAEIDAQPKPPVPVDDGSGQPVQGVSQADFDAAMAKKDADKQAALDQAAADSKSVLDAKQAELDKALADDSSDKAALQAKSDLLSEIDALLHPAPVPPVQSPVDGSV